MGLQAITFILIFVGVLLIVEGIYLLAFGNSIRSNSRMNRRLALLEQGKAHEEVLNTLRKEREQHRSGLKFPPFPSLRNLAAQATRGRIVLERPDLIKKLAEKHGARDTTARGTAVAELESMQSRPSQDDPRHEIPEKSFVYRLAKRFWFNDFGAYDNPAPVDGIDLAKPADLVEANQH